ncbi:hypothetical protein QTJ18_14165 [Rhizobium sp. SSA_523]|nr:hypothetical protein QTJ18_14165 [Rhizobium sp. SSA_523]
MFSTRTTWPIAALLPMWLAGCVSASGPVASAVDLARVCPAPTSAAKQQAILRYLEGAEPSPDLDALATEWERLDEGARKARGER